MKKLTLIFAAACLFIACSNEKSFKISGTLTEFGNPDESNMIYLKTRNTDEILVNLDSAIVKKDGTFALKGKSSETDLYFLADRDNVFVLRFFVDPSNSITINGNAADIPNIKVEGSQTQELYAEYLSLLEPLKEQQELLRQKYYDYATNESISEEELEKIQEELVSQFEQAEEAGKTITLDFIQTHSNHIVAAYLVYRNTQSLSNSEEIEKQLELLDTVLENKFVTLVKNRLERVKNTEESALLPNIELPDAEGQLISTQSLRGKYLFVDFWASWCGPCIREIPYMKKAYAEFQDKGFEIYSISLDDNKEAWLNAIAKYELNWLHVSDLLAFNSPVAKQIAVAYVPHTFLLDPNGVILAVDVRGEDLENRLKELLP
ncbi:MAG: AhpC/TSA family protein [Lentimicrobiaceae bacterium]|nr:AhpC/TSA family protein [Lentimicrobiaceae bacterium]